MYVSTSPPPPRGGSGRDLSSRAGGGLDAGGPRSRCHAGRRSSRKRPPLAPFLPYGSLLLKPAVAPLASGPMPTVPPLGAGGRFALRSWNFLRSNSWLSSNVGISLGRRGSGSIWKYGCSMASAALVRVLQSSFKSSLRRPIAPWPNSLKRLGRLPERGRGVRWWPPGSFLHPGIFSSVGEPIRSQMSSSWCASLSPDRMGLPTSISPKMQLYNAHHQQLIVQSRTSGKNSPNAPDVDGRRVLPELE